MLEIEGLVKRYLPPPMLLRPLVRVAAREPVKALRGVSLDVAPGEIVGLVGPNGAGKTTLIKIVGTLLTATAGRVLVDGFENTKRMDVRRRLGLVLTEERGVYWRLTGRQNLEFFAVLGGLSRRAACARAGVLLGTFGLAEVDKLVFGYSSGMRARLNLARALLHDPGVVVLDEPTRGLDPLASAEVERLLESLAAEGRSILLSSHSLEQVAALCHRVVVLIDGEVRYSATPEELALTAHDGPAAALVRLLSREAGAPAAQ